MATQHIHMLTLQFSKAAIKIINENRKKEDSYQRFQINNLESL